MIAWILACGLALASEPAPFAGLVLEDLDALGLGAPTLSRTIDEVRLPFGDGGFVVLSIAPSVDAAEQVFEGRQRTSANLWPPTAPGLPGDRAAGDGALVLVRSRNAVVLVRDPAEHAAEVAGRVLAALTEDPARCAPVLREDRDPDGAVVRWDRCGRRLP